MLKNNKITLLSHLLILITCLFSTTSHTAKPLWTFTTDPDYPPTVSVTPVSSAAVRYLVTNQTNRVRTLVMTPISGITQSTTAGSCPNPFALAAHQSCTLTLLVNGSTLLGDVQGGPVVCEQGSKLQCYQPSVADSLNISKTPIAHYAIIPSAGYHGSITPNTTQYVLAGANLTFYATPDPGYFVDEWLVDGGLRQRGGGTLTLTNINKNHSVEVTFTPTGTIYAGLANGSLYFSTNNGINWTQITSPWSNNAVNGLFATATTLYVGSANGQVYYSTNNGSTWNVTAPVPGGTAVLGLFITTINNTVTLYTGTADGHVYYTVNGTNWTATAVNPGTGAINSLFITPTQTIYAGSDDGNVYYTNNFGAQWNTISGPTTMPSSAVQNVFATNSALYINTRHTSSNSTLPPGTIDFEYSYYSNSLTSTNPTWTLFSQITYTLFVNADASLIHAGTQDGYVYSLTTGNALGFIAYSPINSLFFLGQ